jgi:para-aminobenzoate synthetase/4-amino-4-deoxychorismate lyase
MKNEFHPLPKISAQAIESQDYFLLFETILCSGEEHTSYIFTNPFDIIKVHDYKAVEGAFKKIEKYSKTRYLAGYFSYELGYLFEKGSFKVSPRSKYPLMHLCVFDKAITFDHKTGNTSEPVPGLFVDNIGTFRINNLKFNFNNSEYGRRVEKIKEYIREGQTYQVNLTGKYSFDFSGSPFALYSALKEKQPVSYAAFCKMGDESIISFSPELFFKRNNLNIYSRPMKGTISRGRDIRQDHSHALKLKQGKKSRAENLMIVDLIRNDLGRVCRAGSVKTSRIFEVEKYNTLLQMTSTVSGVLREGVTYLDIFRNIFPGGSITGAPKIRTMQIIKELEKKERNIYCGALGMIQPDDRAVFNMPIRTISIRKNKGSMGVGSGIVIDSDARQEYAECILKANFLTHKRNDFQLLETLAWDKEYLFLKEHLHRLEKSACYFGFSFDRSLILGRLRRVREGFNPDRRYRIRLLLEKSGVVSVEYSPLVGFHGQGSKYIAVSRGKIDPDNTFLYHKTTNRRFYDDQHRNFSHRGYFDVLFLNTRNEITEGAISNIIIEQEGQLYTPPVSCGLLPGIYRAYLLKKGRVKEKVLFFDDVVCADRLFLCNSVRGLVEVKLKR